jgi:hypothetical protein
MIHYHKSHNDTRLKNVSSDSRRWHLQRISMRYCKICYKSDESGNSLRFASFLNNLSWPIRHFVILCKRSGKDNIVKIVLSIVIIYRNEGLVSSTNKTDSHDISGRSSVILLLPLWTSPDRPNHYVVSV